MIDMVLVAAVEGGPRLALPPAISLVPMTLDDAVAIAWANKRAFRRPRPHELDPSLATALSTMKGLSYPSDVAAGATAASEGRQEVFGGARAHVLWNEIARVKLLEYGDVFDAPAAARVLAALNIAFADSAVARPIINEVRGINRVTYDIRSS